MESFPCTPWQWQTGCLISRLNKDLFGKENTHTYTHTACKSMHGNWRKWKLSSELFMPSDSSAFITCDFGWNCFLWYEPTTEWIPTSKHHLYFYTSNLVFHCTFAKLMWTNGACLQYTLHARYSPIVHISMAWASWNIYVCKYVIFKMCTMWDVMRQKYQICFLMNVSYLLCLCLPQAGMELISEIWVWEVIDMLEFPLACNGYRGPADT